MTNGKVRPTTEFTIINVALSICFSCKIPRNGKKFIHQTTRIRQKPHFIHRLKQICTGITPSFQYSCCSFILMPPHFSHMHYSDYSWINWMRELLLLFLFLFFSFVCCLFCWLFTLLIFPYFSADTLLSSYFNGMIWSLSCLRVYTSYYDFNEMHDNMLHSKHIWTHLLFFFLIFKHNDCSHHQQNYFSQSEFDDTQQNVFISLILYPFNESSYYIHPFNERKIHCEGKKKAMKCLLFSLARWAFFTPSFSF